MHDRKIYIIAEAGVNHNGDLMLAKQLIDVAANAGADAVKFQTFRAEDLASASAGKAAYQVETTGQESSQLKMLQDLELSEEAHHELMAHCRSQGIQFLSTSFDLNSTEFLKSLDLPFWKIPSGEITHIPYIQAIANTGKPVLISTGMANLGEIEVAIDIFIKSGYDRRSLTLLHCTTNYPADFVELNLSAIATLRETFQVDVGYSDHSAGIEASIAAVALGATVVEKHFTLDRSMPGPDHRASLEPSELESLVLAVRNIEMAIGHGRKEPTLSELANLPVVRKGIYAKQSISRGETLTSENLICKRPVATLPASLWSFVLGGTAQRNFSANEPIDFWNK
ncbi:MAG: N-acetylneuraminate synthase [Leptospiraceae bacterium]